MAALTVLIADDHQLFREGMESLLKKIPSIRKILHANTGKEALDAVDKYNPDLIFMDIRMPDGNGFETTKQIRTKNDSVKIIALTMMEDSHSVVTMFRAGVNGYLLKNTSFDELREAIESILKGERYYSRDISHILIERVIDSSKERGRNLGSKLTAREKEIIGLICRGFTNKDVGSILEIATKTVESHRANIYSKLGISNTADLAFYALEKGLVTRSV